jgi:hypothetical protein
LAKNVSFAIACSFSILKTGFGQATKKGMSVLRVVDHHPKNRIPHTNIHGKVNTVHQGSAS